MPISATEAKNRFGYYASQAKTEPVIIEKDGRPDTVLLDYQAFRALEAAALKRTQGQRRREFNETYSEWIRAQQADHERNGLWSQGQVAWQQP